MSMWIGRAGNCWWNYAAGTLTEEEWCLYVDQIRELLTKHDGQGVLLSISNNSSAPSGQMRAQLAEVTKQNAAAFTHVGAHALTCTSTMVRGVLTAMNWLFKHPFPEQVFDKPSAALSWLAFQSPEFDRMATWTSVVRAVPPASLWNE